MTDFNFNIKGIEEVNNILKTLPNSINERIQSDINRKGASIVKAELKESAPEGDNNKKQKEKIGDNVIIKKSSSTGFFIGFTKKVWYVKLLEMGTVVRQTLGKGKYAAGANRGLIIRKPFIEKAHNETASKVVDYITTNYLKIVNRSLKRLTKKFR